jgi:ABC-type Fe3+/spermidine/putrescine transport system ATPase subunit
VKLTGLDHRRPLAMSGGQRQRVALARALVIRPTVLLLDEPLSNLDLKLRETMRLEITEVQRRTGVTTILVTHDQGEALVMSDRIAVMNRGRIEQVGAVRDIYEHPATRFVAEFIGSMNTLPAVALGDGRVRLGDTDMSVRMPQTVPAGQAVLLAFRPERCSLSAASPPAGTLALPSTVIQHVYLGTRIEIHVRRPDGAVCVVDLPNDRGANPPQIGAAVALCVAPEDCIAYPG